MNITVSSRAGYLDFGIVGCRRSVPSLQRLLFHLEDSLAGLEKAVGAGTATKVAAKKAPTKKAPTKRAATKKAAVPPRGTAASRKPATGR
jgi:hypothetical protein